MEWTSTVFAVLGALLLHSGAYLATSRRPGGSVWLGVLREYGAWVVWMLGFILLVASMLWWFVALSFVLNLLLGYVLVRRSKVVEF